MRSLLPFAVALALLAVAVPAAAAEDDASPVAGKTLDRVSSVVASLTEQGLVAGATAATATASGAGKAAQGTASLLEALADAAAAAGRALASGAAVLASGTVAAARGLAVAGSVVADLAVAAFAALVAGLGAAFSLLASGARALGTLLVVIGGLLAEAFGRGATWVAENPRAALYSAAAVGGTAAATGLGFWLKRLGAFAPLAGLYTRIASGAILDNGVRAKVFEEVRASPGIHPSALKEKLGLGWGTVVYHLDRLEETGLVTSRRGSGQKCYFVNGSGLAPEAQKAAAALKHPSAKAIADFVRARPAAAQKEVGETLGMSPALVSWHVKRLVAAGILAQERTSRGVVLRAAPPLLRA